MRYIRCLIDFDLKLPAGAQLATVVLSKSAWINLHARNTEQLVMKR